jgi:acylphosphatase
VGQAASRLRLAGWVRNCPNGTVEVAVDGPPDAQQALIAALRRGPPGADVACVEPFPVEEPIDPPIATPFRVMR